MIKCRKVPSCCTACTLYELPTNFTFCESYKKVIKNHIKKRKATGYKLMQAFVTKTNTDSEFYGQSKTYKYLRSLGFKDVSNMPFNGRHEETDVRLLVLKLAEYKEI